MQKRTVEILQRDIAAKIEQILKAKNWTQQDLANASGKSKSYISELLSSKRNLTLKTIVELENALKQTIIGT